jgi:sulfate transport system ATP-binding protein
MRIVIENLTKHFGPTLVLDNINIEIREREFLGLLGPSGSGKTTLLRILAGLEFPDDGAVLFDGENALLQSLQERQVGFVFQHYALFNHMKVADNIAFGLQVRPRASRPSREEIAKRVAKLLELVQLDGFGDRFPAQLSGGQRQRVALARALATEPKVLLLDEPFGALDAKVRTELRRWLRELHDQTGVTTVFVTHDQDEALDLADRVAVMSRGRIEQIGTSREIYEAPVSPFVYDFLGPANAFDCQVEDGYARVGNKLLPIGNKMPDGAAVAFVRPHDVVLSKPGAAPASQDAILPGVAMVRLVSALGPTASVELSYEGRLVEAEIGRDKLKELNLKVGSQCAIQLRLPWVFPKNTGADQRTERRPMSRRQKPSGQSIRSTAS